MTYHNVHLFGDAGGDVEHIKVQIPTAIFDHTILVLFIPSVIFGVFCNEQFYLSNQRQ